MKKIFLLSTGNYDFDGRLRELYKVLDSICVVDGFMYKSKKGSPGENQKDLKPYTIVFFLYTYIHAFLKYIKTENINVLFVDNYFSAPIGWLLNLLFKPEKSVYDMRELYCGDSNYKLKTRLLIFFERRIINSFDVVIVANNLRKNYLIEKYNINGKVLVFENIRFLEPIRESEQAEVETVKERLKLGKYNIIDTGGYSRARGTHKLINEFLSIADKLDISLTIVGGGRAEFENDYPNELLSVNFVDKVELDTLRHILAIMDIGVVYYSFSDMNNKLCASGKVYEYIGFNMAVITSSHETLLEFCIKSKSGVSDDCYSNAIIRVLRSLDVYKHNAALYRNSYDVSNNSNVFKLDLIKALGFDL
ncbi:glycosyltransferase family protein [Vibrio cidicii]|uniref:hypothetical protein n=1 Tax=Vibrio cidicii TaxID=1763883 RepID=UPI0037046FBF